MSYVLVYYVGVAYLYNKSKQCSVNEGKQSLFLKYHNCLRAYIISLVDFDVILGMNQLSPHHVVLDYYAKTMTLTSPSLPYLVWKGVSDSYPKGVIAYVSARRLMDRSCLSYLAHVHDCSQEAPSLEDTRVMREFMYVFLIDLLGVPLFFYRLGVGY